MANVNVTYDDLRNQASQLRNGQKAIEDQLSQLKSQIDNLVSSGYVTDKSSKAFQSSYHEFNTGITKTLQGLEGMSKFLKGAATQMQHVDEQLASSLK